MPDTNSTHMLWLASDLTYCSRCDSSLKFPAAVGESVRSLPCYETQVESETSCLQLRVLDCHSSWKRIKNTDNLDFPVFCQFLLFVYSHGFWKRVMTLMLYLAMSLFPMYRNWCKQILRKKSKQRHIFIVITYKV